MKSILLKMAWRNIWRNKTRTGITMLSITLAFVLALFTRSMQKGSYANMISNAVRLSTGYIQIHKNGYWEDKSLNNSMIYNDEVEKKIASCSNVGVFVPRLESFALVSSGKRTKGTMVLGTIPSREVDLYDFPSKITKGKYLADNDSTVVIGYKLARYLGVDVGDTLVLLGQGFHGITAADEFIISGLINLPVDELNRELVIMPLPLAQYYYGADSRVTSVSLMLKDLYELDNTLAELKKKLGKNYEVMPWDVMNPEIVQAIESDNLGGKVMFGILYLIIGFGVFGTVMMMTLERRKEFAVMIAVGMRKTVLLKMLSWETAMIGLVSSLVGLAVIFPVLYYLHFHPIPLTGDIAESLKGLGVEPILPFSIRPEIFINQFITVAVIVFIAALYPLLTVLKLNMIKALRG
jgi:ABC-type lipoprotein release transport system permease subunit